MKPEDGYSPSTQKNKATSWRQSQYGYWEVSKTNRRNINRQIPRLPQDLDFEWVVRRPPVKVEIFSKLISKRPFQGQSNGVNRDVVCQLSSEAGHPPYFAARLKKLAYGMNEKKMSLDADGTFWTRHCVFLTWFPHELTDVVMCCTQPKHVDQIGTKRTLHSDAGLMTSHLNRVFEKMLDPIGGSPDTGKSLAGIINLLCRRSFRNRWNPNRITCRSQTKEKFPSWIWRLERCTLYMTIVGWRILN